MVTNTNSKQELGHSDSPTVPLPLPADGRVEMSQDEVDAIIRNKRKVRDPKACYACHRRKVKCDRNLPCDSCVKRDHPELCSYERPTKKRRIALSGQAPTVEGGGHEDQETDLEHGATITVSKEQWDKLQMELYQLRAGLRNSVSHADPDNESSSADHDDGPPSVTRSEEENREGIHAPSNQMGTMHLGSRSVLAYMMGLGRSKSVQDAAQTLLVEDVLPKLGLDNESATYPFVDLWSSESSIHNVNGLCSALPDDALCREFFVAYRDVACTIYPVLPDISLFETTLNYMLANRARANQKGLEIDPDKPFGVSLPWLSLAFAVFASGAQATKRPAKERELTSQVYICSSYHALRMSNFMIHPCLETVEASLIIGNVLSYNMNPGVAYIFLGMTVRMAFTMGLQINSQNFSDHELWTRRRVWWALAWQDSHFAVSYDRPTSTVMCIPEIPYTRHSSPGNRSYAESMFAIIRLTQEILRERMLNSQSKMSWSTIQRYTEEVAAINAAGAIHLRDRLACAINPRHLERLALKLHSSYITSELCRPALKEQTANPSGEGPVSAIGSVAQSPPMKHRKSSHTSAHSPSSTVTDSYLISHLRRECVRNLEETIAAYVELYSYSECAARSWIGIQRSMSAAFLLATLPDALQEPRVRLLLQDLQTVITKRTTEDPSYEISSYMDASNRKISHSGSVVSESPHWARSMAKSLNALEAINAALAEPYSAASAQPSSSVSWSSGPNTFARPTTNTAAISGVTSPLTQPKSVSSNGSLLKQEPFSPGSGLSNTFISSNNSPSTALANYGNGMGNNMPMGPFTPDSLSTGGSEWNHGNMTQRAMEYVQPALWG